MKSSNLYQRSEKIDMNQLEKIINFLYKNSASDIEEILREIPGTLTEGTYFISNRGKVYSFCGNDFLILTPELSTGYERVKINGKNKLIHRLVAEAFIPNPENKAEVHHKDKNPRNNSVNNLVWLT